MVWWFENNVTVLNITQVGNGEAPLETDFSCKESGSSFDMDFLEIIQNPHCVNGWFRQSHLVPCQNASFNSAVKKLWLVEWLPLWKFQMKQRTKVKWDVRFLLVTQFAISSTPQKFNMKPTNCCFVGRLCFSEGTHPVIFSSFPGGVDFPNPPCWHPPPWLPLLQRRWLTRG